MVFSFSRVFTFSTINVRLLFVVFERGASSSTCFTVFLPSSRRRRESSRTSSRRHAVEDVRYPNERASRDLVLSVPLLVRRHRAPGIFLNADTNNDQRLTRVARASICFPGRRRRERLFIVRRRRRHHVSSPASSEILITVNVYVTTRRELYRQNDDDDDDVSIVA